MEALSAALTALEDRLFWDLDATLAAAADIERDAARLGAEQLVQRARLVQANTLMRQGADLAGAVRRMWDVNLWATGNGCRPVLARSHLMLAQTFHNLGEHGACLEHAVQAVELLDETASPFAQVWYRIKLADALGWAGSADAARERYRQAEELALRFGDRVLHLAGLNNLAYTELDAGAPERAWAVAQRLQRAAAGYGEQLDPQTLDTIGRILIENGRYAEAEATMHTCLDRYREGRHESPEVLAEYLLTLATAQRCLGATDRAGDSLERSWTLCAERDLGDVRVRVRQEQAELFAARGDYASAFRAHKEFFADYEQVHSLQREAQARTRQALFETAEARAEAERFREQAYRDPLTGLPNRRYVEEHLPTLLREAGPDAPLTLAIVDLDHFKVINDTLSHDVGDQVLVAVAGLLDAHTPAGGFAARLGGEEFLLVLPGSGRVPAVRRLERLRRAVRSHAWQPLTRGRPVTVSIGVAGTDTVPGADQTGLFAVADRNLYAAKHAGRDRVVAAPAGGRRYRDAPAPTAA